MEAGKILVLRLSSLGDVVLCSSAMKSLHEHFPNAAIDFVVREDLQSVAAMLPGVARVHAIPRGAGLLDLLQKGMDFGAGGYDHVFDLHQSLRSRLLTWRLRAKLRPGFDKQHLPRWILVNLHRHWYRHFGGARSLRERTLEPLRRLGLPVDLHPTELRVPEAARAQARALLAQAEPAGTGWIAVGPGARWPAKRWPRFAELVAALARSTDAAFVVLGSREDEPLAAQVWHASGVRGVNLTGKLDLTMVAAVLERCALVIANDSGLLHVAEAVGRPVLGFWGPTSPAFGYTPYRPESRFLYRPPPCSPCSKNGSRPCYRPTHECMLDISVEEATRAAESVLETYGTREPS